MKRLIRTIVIFTFVMVATIAFNRVEVRAEENGYIDEYGVLHYTGPSISAEEREAIQDQLFYEEYYGKTSQESTSSSATSSNSSATTAKPSTQTTSPAPKYTDAEIEAAWVESSRTEATCTNDGVITYKNSLTGKTKTEAIPATGNHTYELTEHVDSTCVNNGYDSYTCSVCGDSYKEEIELTPHTEGEPQTTKAASSFSEGESKVYCTSCGELVSTNTIPQTFPISFTELLVLVLGSIVVLVSIVILFKKRLIKK